MLLRGLVHHLKAKQNSGWNVFLILACFSWTIFNTALVYFAVAESRQKDTYGRKHKQICQIWYVHFVFFLFPVVHCVSQATGLHVCLFFFLPTLLKFHKIWQKMSKTEYKRSRAVKGNSENSASLLFLCCCRLAKLTVTLKMCQWQAENTCCSCMHAMSEHGINYF